MKEGKIIVVLKHEHTANLYQVLNRYHAGVVVGLDEISSETNGITILVSDEIICPGCLSEKSIEENIRIMHKLLEAGNEVFLVREWGEPSETTIAAAKAAGIAYLSDHELESMLAH